MLLGSLIDVTAASMPGLVGPSGRTCHVRHPNVRRRRDACVIIGFEATGKLRAEDYRDVVLPALERAAATGEVRFVIVMKEFDGMTGGAPWQDLKVGFRASASKRIALVTDIEWMQHLTNLFGWMTPGETKTFSVDQRDAAIAWAAG